MTPETASFSSYAPLNFRRLTNALRRRARLIFVVTAVGVILVGLAATFVAPSYTATAEIVLGSAADANPTSARSTAPPDNSNVDTQIAMLTSTSQLCRLLQGLPTHPEFQKESPAGNGGWLEPIRAKFAAALSLPAALFSHKIASADQCGWPAGGSGPHLTQIMPRLKVFQQRRSLVIAVSYTDANPARAVAVVNEIVQRSVEQQRDQRRERGAEVVTWLERQLAVNTGERDAAERAVRQYRLANGTDPLSKEDLAPLIEAKRQFALAQSEYERRRDLLEHVRRLERNGDRANLVTALGIASGENQASLSDTIRDAIGKLEGDVQFGRIQAQAIGGEIESMERATGSEGGQKSLQTLEERAAALARITEDLQRKRNESLEDRDLARPEISVLTLARTPLRPNRISPALLIPPGAIAFFILGSVLAVTLDQLDASFRNERDVTAELGLSCVGLIPEMPEGSGDLSGRPPSLGDMRPSYYQAVRSVLVNVFELGRLEREPKIVLVTSSIPQEGKSMLGVSLGLCAAQLGQRVLLVDLGGNHLDVALNSDGGANWVASALTHGDAANSIAPVPSLGCDYLSGREVGGGDLLGFLINRSSHQFFRKLRSKYDCIIIDGPPVLGSAETRILASLADEVLLAIRWGKTRRDVARYAAELFRASGITGDEERARLKTVLTRADLSVHARYKYGDAAELLVTYDRLLRSRRRSPSLLRPPNHAWAPWRGPARIFASLRSVRRSGTLKTGSATQR